MSSTDQNLNHPNQVIEIGLQREIDSMKAMKVCNVTQDFYDHLAIPDPHTCYVITDSKDGRMYYGTTIVKPWHGGPRYFMTISDEGEYVIYKNEKGKGAFVLGNDCLTEVSRYVSPEDALNTLAMYNRVGSHRSLNLQIYSILINYINEDIGIDSTVLGIITAMGPYNESAEFQKLIQFLMTMNPPTPLATRTPPKLRTNQTFSAACAEELMRRAKQDPSSMYALCNSIYGIFFRYNLFKDCKESPTMANLSEPIDDIVEVYTKWHYSPLSQ